MCNKKCPECGGQLELRKFVDSWSIKTKKPKIVNEDLYCPKCKLRWMDFVGPHTFFSGSR